MRMVRRDWAEGFSEVLYPGELEYRTEQKRGAEGIPIEELSVAGLRGKGWLSWLAAPFRLTVALAQALAVMRRYRPRGEVRGVCVYFHAGGWIMGDLDFSDAATAMR